MLTYIYVYIHIDVVMGAERKKNFFFDMSDIFPLENDIYLTDRFVVYG